MATTQKHAVFLIQDVCCRPFQAIAEANREVEEVICTASSGKCVPYGQYSPTVWAEIGKYTCCYKCTSLFHTPPCFLHMLNFHGRPIARKFYSVKFFLMNLHMHTGLEQTSFCVNMYYRVGKYVGVVQTHDIYMTVQSKTANL